MNYHPIKLLSIAGLLLALGFCSQNNSPEAKAELIDAAGKNIGSAVIAQTADGVTVSVQVEGLTEGSHGIHIHETGTCTAPDFKSAGGHFNPTHKQHGLQNPEGAHSGDLPNLIVGADGKAQVQLSVKNVKIQDGDTAILKSGGTALVIHAGADDGKSNPSGNSGDRVACGVIVKK